MALIKCSKCNQTISDTTKKCIHCGESTHAKRSYFFFKSKPLISLFIALILVSVPLLFFYFNDSSNNYSNHIEDTVSSKNNSDSDIPANIDYNDIGDTFLEIEEESTNSDSTNNNNSYNYDSNSSASTPTIDETDILNNADTNNKTSVQKEIISATLTKTCPLNYTYDNEMNMCSKELITNGIFSYSCPSSPNIKLVDTVCEITYTMSPYNGSCLGTGYILDGTICKKTEQSPAIKGDLICPSGYQVYSMQLNDTRCYRYETIEVTIVYSCPNSYSLNSNNECER